MQGLDRKHTILLVEDDKDLTLFYTSIFDKNYDVITSASGQHAIDTVRLSSDIDLVILDYRLEDMSGLDVLKEIKQCRPAVPVIFVTAYGDEDVAVKAFRFGAKDYLKKPFGYSELLERIEFCLSLKHADETRRTNVSLEGSRYAGKTALKDISSRLHLNIQKALHYVDENFTAKINLTAAAEKACLSRFHFSRAFKTATNMTYQDYVTHRRVYKAKELLKDPSLSITEIAHFVGYSELNNLVRNFKKQTGLTPSEFRIRHLRA
jgi:two-component system, response regulator YesN